MMIMKNLLMTLNAGIENLLDFILDILGKDGFELRHPATVRVPVRNDPRVIPLSSRRSVRPW
jgi:hypothetical protein